MSHATTYLSLISLSQLRQWDVKRYLPNNDVQFTNLVPLREILSPYKEPVSREELIENKWRIISKINFGGQLFLREFEGIYSYKGKCNLVPPNSIIYSKINVRHGCIYYHEKDMQPFGVSSEYPTFIFDEKKINGNYLMSVLRSNAFKTLLNRKTTGISKARVKQNEFLDIEIPLPTFQEQERIINKFKSQIDIAEKLEMGILEKELNVEYFFNEALGITNILGDAIKNGLQTIQYSELDKWSIDDIFQKNTIISKKFPLVNLNSVCTLITDGTHQTPTYVKEGVIFLSAKNVTKEVIDWENVKYVTKQAHSDYCKRVKPEVNDILLAKNGTTGVAAIIDVDREFSIYVSLALLKPNHDLILPRYLLHLLNSKLARTQFFSRLIGIGVPNLHLGEIKQVLIPLPTKEKQKAIVAAIDLLKDEIVKLKNEIKSIRTSAQNIFEKEIFAI